MLSPVELSPLFADDDIVSEHSSTGSISSSSSSPSSHGQRSTDLPPNKHCPRRTRPLPLTLDLSISRTKRATAGGAQCTLSTAHHRRSSPAIVETIQKSRDVHVPGAPHYVYDVRSAHVPPAQQVPACPTAAAPSHSLPVRDTTVIRRVQSGPLLNLAPCSAFPPPGHGVGTRPHTQLAAVVNRIQELQVDCARLRRRMSLREDDESAAASASWTVRYARRLALWSNLILGSYLFVARFSSAVGSRSSSPVRGWAAQHVQQLLLTCLPTGSVLSRSFSLVMANAFLKGTQRSMWFFLSAAVFMKHSQTHTQKHMAFAISTLYSLLLLMKSGPETSSLVVLNVLFNCLHLLSL